MFETEQKQAEAAIIRLLDKYDIHCPGLQWNYIPFSGHWGISTSFFQTAAAESKAGKKIIVPQRAQEIAEMISSELVLPKGFERAEAVRGYLNVYFSTNEYAGQVVETILSKGSDYGKSPLRNEKVMVEFSHPNTHKAFHVGHLRGAILGDVISRILEFAGYQVVRANYPGDMGLHVIKWLWNYMKFHPGEKPTSDITHWMGEKYAEANRRLEENPDFEEEVRKLYTLWNEHDPEVVKLWEETRQWSLDGFNQIYATLGIHFDKYYFNSQMEAPGKEEVQNLIDKGIAIDERPTGGAVIVKLDDLLNLGSEKYRVLIVLRSDSTALYATEDLALAKQKFTDYPDLVRSLYIVDVRQSLHFLQVFKTLEIAGYPWAKRCAHEPYELVNLPGNVVMASREGTVVLLEDLIREAIQRARKIVDEKNPELPEKIKNEIASAVAIGALKYPMISRESTKIVTFDWDSALDFNGQAAPYIQYAYVRALKIIQKSNNKLPDAGIPEYALVEAEIELINLLSKFEDVIKRAAENLRTLDIANYAYELAKAFNDFYTVCPVLQAEPQVRDFRLRLVEATRHTIKNSLGLMGITAPEAM